MAVLAPLLVACAHEPRGGEAAQGALILPSSATPMEPWRASSTAYLSERNRCIDDELARQDLNEFGDPKGTTYQEGAPLGVSTAAGRYEYVLRRRPDIGAACSRAPGEPER